MTDIVLEDVRRSFGGREVLRGVSARAERGRVIGLLGRNGEGKSTLFKIILDMLAADGGRVEVCGRRPDGGGSLREHIGYVPERPSFHGFMTLAEVLDFRARVFPRWDGARARRLAGDMALDVTAPVAGASKGMLGKLAWICAVAHDPQVLLLDEPTSGLDALVRDEVLAQLIGELHDGGKTLLIANHHMEELAGVLDEVWVIGGGRITRTVGIEDLRAGALRLSGRIKEGAAIPSGLVELSRDGLDGEWAALDDATAVRAVECGVFERLTRAALPVEESFKALLKEAAGAGS